MGLDGVELVMALEEGFGVAIADAEAEACVTPAAVIEVIFGKLRTGDERACVPQRGFYLLRKAMMETLGVPRRNAALSSDVRSFTTGRTEREVWSALKTAVQAMSWPALSRPKRLVAFLWCLSAVTFLALIPVLHWAVAAGCALLVASAAMQVTRPLCSRVPARYSRIRELVPFAAASDAIFWTRDDVAALVKKLVIEQLGLREGQYREDANFVKDLGLG